MYRDWGIRAVALSRAREGLFIMGNALNLAAGSTMWRSIINELQRDGAVANAFPIVCHRHPDTIAHVSKPGQLPRLAPDGKPSFRILGPP